MLTDYWHHTPVHMMDFEGSPASGVVEFGVVTLQHGQIQQARTGLCRPTGAISAADRAVHGISENASAPHPPFTDNYQTFVALRRSGIFAAHNRHAENQFLSRTWALPPAVPDWSQPHQSSHQWGPWIDTLQIYRTLYPGQSAYGLGDLLQLFQLQEDMARLAASHCPPKRVRPHCALYDALASALLLLRLDHEPSLRQRLTPAFLLQNSHQLNSQGELF